MLTIELTKNDTNKELQKIDVAKAKLFSITNSSNFYEGKEKYVLLILDNIKFYWKPNGKKINTAIFYLDDRGHRVAEPCYGTFGPKTFFKNDGKFEIKRMNNSFKFIKLGKSSFRPAFNFYTKDNRKDKTALLTKEPNFEFKYRKGITENEAILYGDIVLMLSSFYHHIKIDFILRRINLIDNTITIKNQEEKNYLNSNGGLYDFGINWELNDFFKSKWQRETIKNYVILAKAIALFNQSHLVDDSSAFLIRYNIIEICDKQKQNTKTFRHILSKNQIKNKRNQALAHLLETIMVEEHDDFKTRWLNVQSLLNFKPMKNQLVSFLERQNIDISTFPLKIKELKELRDNITHDSIDKVDLDQLQIANTLLYRICGILILNLMGIKDWKLETQIF